MTLSSAASPMRILDRPEFLVRLTEATRRRGGSLQVLIVVDVERLEDVNVRMGLAAGDAVLDALGASLASGLDHRAVVGRIDGDEFAIVCPVRAESAALALARRLVGLATQSVAAEAGLVQVRVNAGLSVVAHGRDPVSESLRRAHVALCEAKRAPTPDPVLYRKGCAAERRAAVVDALETALASRKLALAYQPIVALDGRQVIGFEALLRWPTSGGVEVPPCEFVPVAEETRLITPIGRWVLDRAVAVAAATAGSRRPRLRMAVNVSPQQLESPEIVTHIEEALCTHGLEGSDLALEITESKLIDNPRAIAVLRSVRRLGCRVGLDDFGTGYSCLASLESLPLDFIKLDRSFTCRLGSNPRSDRIVHATVSMAHDLGLESVAEGIETELQYDHVVQAGCTHAQGYLFGRPTYDVRWTDEAD
jgi:diguanylate cyclase (GGDEF)-like protein